MDRRIVRAVFDILTEINFARVLDRANNLF